MTWEQKTELCKLFNTDQQEQALDLTIQNLETMDDQAWEMFFTGVELTPTNIEAYREKHLQIVEKSKLLKSDSMRTAMRMAYYEDLLNVAAE